MANTAAQRGEARQRGVLVPIVVAVTMCASLTYAATNVCTDPMGYITLIAVGSNVPPGYTFQALGMTRAPVVQGKITSIVSNEIVVQVNLTPGQFNFTSDGHPTHFVEILDGANPGLMDDIVGNSSNRIYTADNNASRITGATRFKVYPHWTIGRVFGPNNEVGLKGGTSASSADNVSIWNPVTQQYETYYYKTGGLGGTGWRSTTSATINKSNVVMYIDQGFLIARKAAGQVTNRLVGAVKLGPTLTPVVGSGYTYVGNVYPLGITLGSSGLYTTNSQTGLNGATTPSAADTVSIWDPFTQTYKTYYYKTGGIGGTGWRSTASASIDASTNVIPVGVPANIHRKIAGDFNWRMPQPPIAQ